MAETHSTEPAHVEYREISEWPGYRVSNFGTVESCFARGAGGYWGWKMGAQWKKLAVSLDKAGRPCVSLSRGDLRRTKRVCVLVLTAFVGPCPEGHEVCHDNGDPSDNRLANLRWGTHTENMADRIRHGKYARGSRHHNTKLTEADVAEMRRLRAEGWSLSRLGKRFGLAKTTVAQIVTGKFWKHVEG